MTRTMSAWQQTVVAAAFRGDCRQRQLPPTLDSVAVARRIASIIRRQYNMVPNVEVIANGIGIWMIEIATQKYRLELAVDDLLSLPARNADSVHGRFDRSSSGGPGYPHARVPVVFFKTHWTAGIPDRETVLVPDRFHP